jgi:Asp-tRNA(Asn)/Glu-tRNA(Gln) amidotransferase A subunit family amidase
MLEINLSPLYSDAAEAQGLIVDFETAGSAAFEFAHHRDQLSEKFVERAEAGLASSYDDYKSALSIVETAQNGLDAAMDGVDVLICPSAPGEAPKGLEATGDPVFNRLGTALRVPCLNIPGFCGHRGLPVGVQLIGRMGDDRRVLAIGKWLHAILQQG